MLYSVDASTMILGLLFVIFYVLINFSLSKVFKKEKASSTIISLCVALLAIYGINTLNWDLSVITFNLGISDALIYGIVPWIILGLAVLSSFAKDPTTGKRRFRLYRLLMVLGAFCILLSFFAFQTTVMIIIGLVLIVLGFLLWIRIRNKGAQVRGVYRAASKSLILWVLFLALIGLALYATIKNISYLIIGAAIGLLIIGIILFSKKKFNLSSSASSNTQGRDYLIKAAKQFHEWAKRQPNPKFVGSWANFIFYLNGNRRGGHEDAICQRLGISKNDFVDIFNRYGLVR